MAATAEGAFPTGLKVMVVDDDPLCLKVIEKMLLVCKYQGVQGWGGGMGIVAWMSRTPAVFSPTVTTCQSSTHALEILREGSTHFDLVLSDVYMPGAWDGGGGVCTCCCFHTVTYNRVPYSQIWMDSNCLNLLDSNLVCQS